MLEVVFTRDLAGDPHPYRLLAGPDAVKISYDPKADALYIKFQDASAARTRKVEDGMLVDVDGGGRLWGSRSSA